MTYHQKSLLVSRFDAKWPVLGHSQKENTCYVFQSSLQKTAPASLKRKWLTKPCRRTFSELLQSAVEASTEQNAFSSSRLLRGRCNSSWEILSSSAFFLRSGRAPVLLWHTPTILQEWGGRILHRVSGFFLLVLGGCCFGVKQGTN